MNNEYLYLENLSQRQFFDTGVERPQITRNSGYVYYAKSLGSAQRIVMRAALSANGFIGSPAQMTALRGTNEKFVRRFKDIESALAERGRTPAESSLEEMDRLWDEIKAREKR